MGYSFTDRYSFLHLCSGSIFRYWGFSFGSAVGLHVIFELIENTPTGMDFINKYVRWWPGGKTVPDNFLNSTLGDNFWFIIGFLIADILLM